jgi:betaine lipid synthase
VYLVLSGMHVYIGAAAVLVFALVGLVLFVSSQQIKVANTGVQIHVQYVESDAMNGE